MRQIVLNLMFQLPLFSINDNIKFLEKIKQIFKRTISWNKYRSAITTQPKNDNLEYVIDPTFRKIKRLFVLLFKNGNSDPTRDSFNIYYMLLVEIKNFNTLINNEILFHQPVKNKQDSYEKIIEMSRNDAYTTGNLLDYLYHQKCYQLIGKEYKQIGIFLNKFISGDVVL